MEDDYLQYLYEDNEGYHFTEDEEKAELVLIPINQYHGLKKAQEIVRRRACQQVKGSEVDEHGYKFLGAEKAYCKQQRTYQWKITKLTPYSTETELEDARVLIERDLRDFYNYCTSKDVHDMLPMSPKQRQQLAQPVQKHAGGTYYPEYEKSHLKAEKAIKWLEQHNDKVLFNVCKYRFNYQLGLYEVTYWANDVF